MITMWYHVTVALRLPECCQALPLEANSEDIWLHTNVDSDNIFAID